MYRPPLNEPPSREPLLSRLRHSMQDTWTRMQQPGSGARAARWSYEQLREFVAGVRFLTTLPLPGTSYLFDPNVIDAGLVIGTAYFPLIGLLLALLLCLLPLLLSPILPPFALAALLVVVLVLLTGGLHLDGLMDSCDGLFGGGSRESKLEIMRDSRVGSFGVLAAACILLLKFAFLSSLSSSQMMLSLLVALPSARAALLLVVALFPSARSTGLGISFRQTVTLPRLLFALVCSLLAALLFGHLAGLLAWFIGLLGAFLLGIWVLRHLGGLTGDIYGAIVEISEVLALFCLLLCRSWL